MENQVIASREYKVIVDVGLFAKPADGLEIVWEDMTDLARSQKIKADGEFDAEKAKERTVVFLDTPDWTLRHHDLLLRKRVKRQKGKTEYTLKCRSEDRYLAAGSDLHAHLDFATEEKLEEDVGVPFVSRFSKSNSIELAKSHEFAGDRRPGTLADAAKLYPGLGLLQRDDLPCPPETELREVQGMSACERVFEGPKLRFDATGETEAATVALILWSKSRKGRSLIAELSFRYKSKNERFSPTVARAARKFFLALQRLDWCRPDALTKTQFMYGG